VGVVGFGVGTFGAGTIGEGTVGSIRSPVAVQPGGMQVTESEMSLPPSLYNTVQTSSSPRPCGSFRRAPWAAAKPKNEGSNMLLQCPAEVCKPFSAARPEL